MTISSIEKEALTRGEKVCEYEIESMLNRVDKEEEINQG